MYLIRQNNNNNNIKKNTEINHLIKGVKRINRAEFQQTAALLTKKKQTKTNKGEVGAVVLYFLF